MKKFLLLLSLLLCSVPAIKAADIVEDMTSNFTDAKKTWMKAESNVGTSEYTCTSTITNLTWKLKQVWSAKASGKIYITFKKQVSAYMETTPGIVCNQIIIDVNSAGSNGGMDICR